jgi:hypothetical protein
MTLLPVSRSNGGRLALRKPSPVSSVPASSLFFGGLSLYASASAGSGAAAAATVAAACGLALSLSVDAADAVELGGVAALAQPSSERQRAENAVSAVQVFRMCILVSRE